MGTLVLALALMVQIGAAVAADGAAGERRAAQCAPCHGVDGIGRQPMYPNLAGQKEAYIVKQLWAFKRGGRKDPSMAMQVRQLSAQDIEDLAAYYANLDCRADSTASPPEIR
jgi:cytochrome c553